MIYFLELFTGNSPEARELYIANSNSTVSEEINKKIIEDNYFYLESKALNRRGKNVTSQKKLYRITRIKVKKVIFCIIIIQMLGKAMLGIYNKTVQVDYYKHAE